MFDTTFTYDIVLNNTTEIPILCLYDTEQILVDSANISGYDIVPESESTYNVTEYMKNKDSRDIGKITLYARLEQIDAVTTSPSISISDIDNNLECANKVISITRNDVNDEKLFMLQNFKRNDSNTIDWYRIELYNTKDAYESDFGGKESLNKLIKLDINDNGKAKTNIYLKKYI